VASSRWSTPFLCVQWARFARLLSFSFHHGAAATSRARQFGYIIRRLTLLDRSSWLCPSGARVARLVCGCAVIFGGGGPFFVFFWGGGHSPEGASATSLPQSRSILGTIKAKLVLQRLARLVLDDNHDPAQRTPRRSRQGAARRRHRDRAKHGVYRFHRSCRARGNADRQRWVFASCRCASTERGGRKKPLNLFSSGILRAGSIPHAARSRSFGCVARRGRSKARVSFEGPGWPP